MPSPKRAWLCLLLLLSTHARLAGSETAAGGSDDAALHLDDDQLHVSVSVRGDVPLDDDDELLRASKRTLNKSTAFLRKNDTRGGSIQSSTKSKARDGDLKGKDIFKRAFSRAIGGGVPGAIAGVVQVLSLMWLRTVINYQYRYGSSFLQALSTLYGMGGIPRLYSGMSFALIQAPLARFISTAANDGISALLQGLDWGPGREVVVAAFVVGFFRMMLMPIDTCKTVLQIESKKGLAQLMEKVKRGHVNLLYSGALANAASSFIGHYPWFYTYNLLTRSEALIEAIPWTTGRNALVGFVSSIVSDTVANFMRVIKTTKQSLGTTRSATTYAETVSLILAVDGWWGLLGRGLKTRILGNALQSIMFTVVWRSLSERWQDKNETGDAIVVEDSSSIPNSSDVQSAEAESER